MATSAHLTLKPEGSGPRDMLFQFERQQKRLAGGVGVSIGVHVGIAVLLLLVARFLPQQVYEAILPDRLREDIVWLDQPGPGGGGGGGNSMPEPPKPAELPKPVVPEPVVQTPPEPVPEPAKEPDQIVPAITPAATTPSPGALSANAASTDSRGSGTGTGAGPGTGSGIGPGSGGNTGGGPMRVGNGVISPMLIHEEKPRYTAEAMRAKVQGAVLLECVVLPDGTVGNVEVVRSLDQSFGLDQEAIRAAKRWRFRPGTLRGEPVPVLVTLEISFTLR